MSKIEINLKLKSNEEEINKKISGIISTNRIVYIDDDIKTTIIINDTVSMKRECKDYTIDFLFTKHTKTKGNYILNKFNTTIPLNIQTKELVIDENKIKIKYHLHIDKEDKGIYLLELNYKKI